MICSIHDVHVNNTISNNEIKLATNVLDMSTYWSGMIFHVAEYREVVSYSWMIGNSQK